MSSRLFVTAGAFLCVVFLAFSYLPAVGIQESDQEALIQEGAEVLEPFKKELMSALIEGLKRGPAEAVAVCSVTASAIASDVSSDEVSMGRTSHKLRNPANAPKAWMKPLIASYLADPEDKAPRVTPLPEGRYGYVEPIYMKSMCLTCHGNNVLQEIKEKIGNLYPNDEATGFEAGEFRGLFWAELDPDFEKRDIP